MAPYCGQISAVSILTGYYKAPPAYSDDQDYIDWEIDLWFWQEITALEKKRQVSASLSKLKPGKIKDKVVRSLGKEVLIAKDTIQKIGKFENYIVPEVLMITSFSVQKGI